ncbi:MAG: efflux RND transporter periplasmic adaptor subunit [Thermogutta sp.]
MKANRKRLMQLFVTLGVAALLVGGAIVVAAAAGVFGTVRAETSTSGTSEGARPTGDAKESSAPVEAVPVVLTPAKEMVFEERLTISGSVLAKRYALVSARIPGTLDQIFVEEGDFVEAGKTKLFQTDSVKLAQAVAIAQEQLRVADCAVREKEALLEKTLVAQQQALTDLARYRDLNARNAVATQVVEHQQAQCRQLEADVRHVQTLIDLAKAQLEQARLNVKIAEKDFTDSLVVAPISGRVSVRLKEPGESAGSGTPVLRIDDLTLVEISVFAPAEYYDRIEVGKSKMRVKVGATEVGELTVTYKSPTVEPKLRTFQVKCLLPNPPAEVVPGRLAQSTLLLQSRRGVGVPIGAVVKREGRNLVFAAKDGKATAIATPLGMQTDGWWEVLSGIEAGTPIISMGQTLVSDGTPLRVIEEAAR